MEPKKWLLDSCLVAIATGKVSNLTAVDRVSHYNGGLFFMPEVKILGTAAQATTNRLGFTPLINGVSKPFVMDLDGRNKQDLSSTNAGFTYGYSASPDGNLISYHENYQVYIVRADGSESQSVFSTAKVGNNVELFQITLDGVTIQLTKTPDGTTDYHTTPSGDGRQLLYGSKGNGIRQLFVMTSADLGETQLTHLKIGFGAMWPHWQPACQTGAS